MAAFGQNEPISDQIGENESDSPHWVALPDPSEEPFSGACWLCQEDAPTYTLELTDDETGQGRVYKLCVVCVERLVGTLEEDK
jgi:hypothetical protein